MYHQYFGFRERPFQLVPDPDYLFLSKSHEEALAYLKYAVSQEEGFVEIIGEVGTGKTMLCRAFLENLADDIESAYIFNPKLNANDLLKAIHDEFNIPSGKDDTKSLIDALNVFLMEIKAQGKKAILIIDEAQNLSKEVLEQIRLLSNLETTKSKLLQIILVGQPELADLLDSYELRQLSQRISLSCRLTPLNFKETKEYIRHRIQVAAQKSIPIFTRAAVRKIYTYSKGIPRLINIACDRCLLTAFGLNRHQVNRDIAASAIDELASRGQVKSLAGRETTKKAVAVICLLVLFGVVWAYRSEWKQFILDPSKTLSPISISRLERSKTVGELHSHDVPDKTRPFLVSNNGPHASQETAMPPAKPSVEISPQPVSFEHVLESESTRVSRFAAMQDLLNQWGINLHIPQDLDSIQNIRDFFHLSAKHQGLHLEVIWHDLSLVRSLNVCAIFEFSSLGAKHPVYLTAVEATDRSMTFLYDHGRERLVVDDETIRSHWSGRAFVFWKNFYNYQGIIPLNSQKESIITLKLHLRDIGYDNVEINGIYDVSTRRAVEALQAKHNIPVDGYVGPLTQIALYNEKQSLPIPHLLKTGV